MGLVAYISLTAVPNIILSPILKGIIEYFIVKNGNLWTTLSNILLLLLFYFLVCHGGYYISLKGIIGYENYIFFNYFVVIFIGFLLLAIDCYIINKIYKHSSANGNGNKFTVSNSKSKNISILYSWLITTIFWIIIIFIFLIPVISSDKIERIDNGNYSIFQSKSKFVSYEKSFFRGKEIIISSYNYGGIVVIWNNKKQTINIQTFFYRWKPSCFIFDQISGFILLKENNDFFLYDIISDRLFFVKKR